MSLKDHRIAKPRANRSMERVGAACAPWTLLLPDAAEGLLSEAEERALTQHLATCPACSEELEAAHRGLAWLALLKDEAPEPPTDLLANILARTTGMAESGAYLPEMMPVTASVGGQEHAISGQEGGPAPVEILRWLRGEEGTWSSLLQPRLAMTGAMAFLSICLTVNLLGISVTQAEAQGLRRGGIHRTMADTGASLIRSFEGLRVVYRVQSRVNEMRAQMDGPAGNGMGR